MMKQHHRSNVYNDGNDGDGGDSNGNSNSDGDGDNAAATADVNNVDDNDCSVLRTAIGQ